MSNNDKNGGLTPAESQDSSAEQLAKLVKLLETFEKLPFDALSKLPVEVRDAILAGRKTVDAEREQLAAEREQLRAEREQLAADRSAHAAEQAKHNAEILSRLKSIMTAAEQAHEREVSQNIFMAEMSNALARMELAGTASKDEQAKAAIDIIDRLDAIQEAAAIAHSDQMILGMSISNRMDEGFSAIGAQNGQLQVSVDRIGEMMNRMHDFIINVRDVVRASQDAIFTFQRDFAGYKKADHEFKTTLLSGVMTRFDQLPEKLGLKVADIKKVYSDLTGASKGLIERANNFAIRQEEHVNALSERIDGLGDLYDGHVRRLSNGVEDQLRKTNSALIDGVEDMLKSLSAALKKSEVHGLVTDFIKMQEQLDHSQEGLTSLLRAIQEEKTNLLEDFQEARAVIQTNVKDIHQSMSTVMDDKQRVMSDLSDAMRVVKSLMDDLERMRSEIVKVAGSVEKIANVSTSGAITVAHEMIEYHQKAEVEKQAELIRIVREEHATTRSTMITSYLGGEQEGA